MEQGRNGRVIEGVERLVYVLPGKLKEELVEEFVEEWRKVGVSGGVDEGVDEREKLVSGGRMDR